VPSAVKKIRGEPVFVLEHRNTTSQRAVWSADTPWEILSIVSIVIKCIPLVRQMGFRCQLVFKARKYRCQEYRNKVYHWTKINKKIKMDKLALTSFMLSLLLLEQNSMLV